MLGLQDLTQPLGAARAPGRAGAATGSAVLEPRREEQLLGQRSLLPRGCAGAGLGALSVPAPGQRDGAVCDTGVWQDTAVNRGAEQTPNILHMGKEQQQGLHAASLLENQIKENPECLGKTETENPLQLCPDHCCASWPGLSHHPGLPWNSLLRDSSQPFIWGRSVGQR